MQEGISRMVTLMSMRRLGGILAASALVLSRCGNDHGPEQQSCALIPARLCIASARRTAWR